MAHRICLLTCVLIGALACRGLADDILSADFERETRLAAHPRLESKRADMQIVPGGPDGKGKCVQLRSREPGSECSLTIKGPIPIQKNLVLAFDYKTEIESGFEGTYLGMAFFVDGKQAFWHSDEFSPTWRHAEVLIPRLSDKNNVMRPGLVLSEIRLYGRVKEKTRVRGETKARMTVCFDNIRLYTGAAASRVSESVQVSYNNPPLMEWAVAAAGMKQRLEYSQDPKFADAGTQRVECPANHYMAPAPLKPGKWYWRVWNESELTANWSDVQVIEVLPEAHRFTTAAVPVERLAKVARPRLLPLAKIDQPAVTPERRAALIKEAAKIRKRGVPEHPGVHVPGDPRWPTWIDWYGKVAGGITGGTGRRLQQIAQHAMLTGDPQLIKWAGELALEACKWDPEGGSAMHRGDIGAHHLLRGLSWCYDVACDSLSPADRETLRKIIVERAHQFAGKLIPFRGSQANNHAWLQALALGEAGIVLIGEHEQAGNWAEHTRLLYIGRFLACLGYQGDNNEGISYWGYGLGFVIEYGDLMRSVCGIDLFEHPWLSQTARFPMYTAPPNAWAVSFADTGMPNHGTRGPAQRQHVRALALRTRDPYALWYTGAREAVDGLMPKAPADLPQSIHYRHIGVVVFNTSLVDGNEGATVAMHSGQYFAGHQHPDQNSFVIHAYGEKLAIDGGYYDWYGSPHFKGYSMTTLAHNTLLVDGKGQAACTQGADGRVKAYYDSTGYGYVVGDASAPRIYNGQLQQFDRRVLFIKPGFVIVHDLVKATNPQAKLDWLLHGVAPIELDHASCGFGIEQPNAALRGRFLTPVAMAVKTGFPVEPVNRYSTNPVPPDNYFPEWVLTVSPKAPGAAAEFLAAMQIQRRGGKADPVASIESVAVRNGHGVRLRCGSSTHLVLLRSSAGLLEAEGFSTDGEVAAIELDASGKILRAMAHNATKTSYKGKALSVTP